ncbi:hypothetical protein AVEN_22017-1 [Araneus ventricosus]|uniref:RNase H type-1 domain-containing protein n=1 Tax=Araneus ventricosus TaxID=182803 RepID=A0A4Y2HSD4_ARAVE|nr:hypothetical protein AVEN_22017-1 [Araneus ventricosus]
MMRKPSKFRTTPPNFHIMHVRERLSQGNKFCLHSYMNVRSSTESGLEPVTVQCRSRVLPRNPIKYQSFRTRDEVQDSHFEVYTDGSKIDGGVGLSVCILNGEIQHKIICKKLEPPEHCLPGRLAAWVRQWIGLLKIKGKSTFTLIVGLPSRPSRATGLDLNS